VKNAIDYSVKITTDIGVFLMRILIVDDCGDFRSLLVNFLSPLGRCDIAEDGQKAVQAVQMACDENDLYDLILLDILMPKMDGHEALNAIRKIENDRFHEHQDGAKILMVTAMSHVREVMRAFRGQCDGYLVKPFDKQALYEQLEKLDIEISVM